jgi:hypothetical protein
MQTSESRSSAVVPEWRRSGSNQRSEPLMAFVCWGPPRRQPDRFRANRSTVLVGVVPATGDP